MKMKKSTVLFLSIASLYALCFFSCSQKNPDTKITTMNDGISDPKNLDTTTFGNGCFWCTEAIFQQLEGVISATSGYSGGHVANPSYEEVCEKNTGHAEA